MSINRIPGLLDASLRSVSSMQIRSQCEQKYQEQCFHMASPCDKVITTTSHLFICHSGFYPRPVLAFRYCLCLFVCLSVCVSVNPELVRAINHHAFKLEPPNLDKRCKTTWLRSLLFGGGGGDWSWPSRSNLTWKAKFTPFWAWPRHNSPSIQARTTKCGQKMQTNLLMVLIILGGDWLRPSWSNLTR